MAFGIGVFSMLRFRTVHRGGLFMQAPKKYSSVKKTDCREITTSTGAFLPQPNKVSFGLLRVFSVVIPFLYVGTLISKNFAALLEEHDIFVPEDDDDDD
ncbi:essential MCU regulator, mitochondrial [Spea bombifrons]|uniref:essential MCU regulator, mitochondrial n=1 Tax=Spea bombifrons TaxID=233779 RepID=UPI002349FC6D|nr:essential MCU regulator, mitochondrial [Spea bombifrons]